MACVPGGPCGRVPLQWCMFVFAAPLSLSIKRRPLQLHPWLIALPSERAYGRCCWHCVPHVFCGCSLNPAPPFIHPPERGPMCPPTHRPTHPTPTLQARIIRYSVWALMLAFLGLAIFLAVKRQELHSR